MPTQADGTIVSDRARRPLSRICRTLGLCPSKPDADSRWQDKGPALRRGTSWPRRPRDRCACARERCSFEICHWQNSVVVSPTSRRRRRLTIHSVLHNQLVAGFSITAGIKRKQQSKKTCAEKRHSALPTRTAAWSAGRRLCSPWGCFALRSAGGPPGWFPAFVIDSQGVPIQTAATRPAFIQPKIKR